MWTGFVTLRVLSAVRDRRYSLMARGQRAWHNQPSCIPAFLSVQPAAHNALKLSSRLSDPDRSGLVWPHAAEGLRMREDFLAKVSFADALPTH